jgi:hypothetical protein
VALKERNIKFIPVSEEMIKVTHFQQQQHWQNWQRYAYNIYTLVGLPGITVTALP